MTEKYFLKIGLLSYLILISISGLATSSELFNILEIIRILSLLVTLIAVFYTIVYLPIGRITLYSLLIWLLLLNYSFLIAGLSGGVTIYSYSLFLIDFLIIGSGLILVCQKFHIEGTIIDEVDLLNYLIYAIISVLLLVLFNGLIFDGSIKFIFDIGSELIGREETYSLGITNFFMIAVIATISYMNKNIGLSRLLLFIFTFIFFILGVMGGGRGELMAGIIVILIALYKKQNHVNNIFFLIIIFILMMLVGMSNIGENFISRMNVLLDGDFSGRDMLAMNIFKLISENLTCINIGCGPGYFQKYFDFDFGLYPHNSILEGIIVFGLPLMTLICIGVIAGIVKYLLIYKKSCPFFLIFIFVFLVSLKSGSLLGSWLLIVSAIFFISYYLDSLFAKKIKKIFPEKI